MAKTSQRRMGSKAKAGVPRKGKNASAIRTTATKSTQITMLLQRGKGASIEEMMKATGWQPHSVRGFMSGTLVKRKGLKIESDKTEGERRYHIVEAEAAS